MITRPTAAPREATSLHIMYDFPVQLLDLTITPVWKENRLSANNAEYYKANDMKAKRTTQIMALDVNAKKEALFTINETTWDKAVATKCKDLYAAVDKISEVITIVLPNGTEEINVAAQKIVAEFKAQQHQLKVAAASSVASRAAELQPTGDADLGF